MILYNLVTILFICLFGFMDKFSNKNKIRIKMLTYGNINTILLLILGVIMFYDYRPLGIAFLMVIIQSNNLKITSETLTEYFSSN